MAGRAWYLDIYTVRPMRSDSSETVSPPPTSISADGQRYIGPVTLADLLLMAVWYSGAALLATLKIKLRGVRIDLREIESKIY